MQLHERREAETQAVLIGLWKRFSKNSIEKKSGFEVGTGRGEFDRPNAIAQVQLFRALGDWSEKPLQTAAKIRCLADVRFSLRVATAQQEYSGAGRCGRRKFPRSLSGANFRCSVSTSLFYGNDRQNEVPKRLQARELCLPRPLALAEICTSKLLPEVGAIKGDDPAHLMETGAHALANAISESLVACRRSYLRNRSGDSRRRLIFEVCRNDGCAVVVVARIEDQADRIPYPFGRLNCSQLVENEDVCLKHGTKNIQFCSLDGRVV